MTTARTLADAIRVLEPGPLDEAHVGWYVPNEAHGRNGRPMHPLMHFEASIAAAGHHDRLFLSGHIGSGKTTELRRIARSPAVKDRFVVVEVEIPDDEAQVLTSLHLLFVVALELYRQAEERGLLSAGKRRWVRHFEALDKELFGARGVGASEGEVELKWKLPFLEIRQELKLTEGLRRGLGQTKASVLLDLVDALLEDMRMTLATQGSRQDVLLFIDGTDRIHRQEQVADIFEANLPLLTAPRVAMVMTVSALVTFGGPSTPFGRRIMHMPTAQVLKKTDLMSPMAAHDPEGVDYLKRVFCARVDPVLFDADAIEQAAVYSGGVLREFFNLLRTAAVRAHYAYQEATVSSITFTDVVHDARIALARALYPSDYEALRAIRQRHALSGPSELKYMQASLVIEFNHQGVWFEVNPLLWEGLASPP